MNGNYQVIHGGLSSQKKDQTLQSSESIGTLDHMTDISRDEIDAKIAASEARTDAKFARLEGKIDLVLNELTNIKDNISISEEHIRDDYRAVKSNQWVVGFGLAALIIAMVALFPVFFNVGTQIQDMVDKSVKQNLDSKK